MKETPSDTDYLSTREAADLLGVALRTVQLWVEAGTLRAWKTAGGHRRIERDSVQALLQQRSGVLAASTDLQINEVGKLVPLHILVVEDDENLRRLMELTMEGWEPPVTFEMAGNGFEGLIKLGRRRPDLLITDLNMPGMDGFRLIRHLREDPQYRDIQIVVMSALRPADIQDRGGLPPDIPVFGKPIQMAELHRLIQGRQFARNGSS